jgi:hypothetical protein
VLSLSPHYKPLGYTKSSQPSLVLSWQPIYTGLTVTTAYMKSPLHSLIPFLPFLLNHLDCHLKNLPQFLFWNTCYIALGRPQQKTLFPVNSSINIETYTQKRQFYCCVRVHFCKNLFTEPLPSNELFRLSGLMSQYNAFGVGGRHGGKDLAEILRLQSSSCDTMLFGIQGQTCCCLNLLLSTLGLPDFVE